MSSVVLVVFVFVAFLVEILAQVLVRSVQEVVLAYGYPVELWVGVEELLKPSARLLVGSQPCGEVFEVDEAMLDEGEINCPACGELLEFDLQIDDPPAEDGAEASKED